MTYDLNINDIALKVCSECGVVYAWKPYRLGQCPLKHDQDNESAGEKK